MNNKCPVNQRVTRPGHGQIGVNIQELQTQVARWKMFVPFLSTKISRAIKVEPVVFRMK